MTVPLRDGSLTSRELRRATRVGAAPSDAWYRPGLSRPLFATKISVESLTHRGSTMDRPPSGTTTARDAENAVGIDEDRTRRNVESFTDRRTESRQ